MKRTSIFLERANRLKLLRFQCNFSKSELSQRTGFLPQSISKWELGISGGISEAEASLLLNSLNTIVECEFEWLWSGTGSEPMLREYN